MWSTQEGVLHSDSAVASVLLALGAVLELHESLVLSLRHPFRPAMLGFVHDVALLVQDWLQG